MSTDTVDYMYLVPDGLPWGRTLSIFWTTYMYLFYCSSEHDIKFALSLGAYHLIVLLYAAWIANKTSKIHTAFSEGKHIRYSVLNGLQFSTIAVAVIYISDNANTALIVKVAAIAAHDISLLALVFGPKLFMVMWGISRDDNQGRDAIFKAQQTHVHAKSRTHPEDSSNLDTSCSNQLYGMPITASNTYSQSSWHSSMVSSYQGEQF